MTADAENAALKATETLIRYQITTAPISPIHIIKQIPGVILFSFSEMSQKIGIDRRNIVSMFGDQNQDAGTIVTNDNGQLRYFVAYNQKLPTVLVQRAMARELGHIVLGHDGTRPDDVRTEEALFFARHLLCPRAMLKGIEKAGIPLTVELVGCVTGCRQRCIDGMKKTPGAHIPASLNKIIQDQFADYISNFVEYAKAVRKDDSSPLADFGSFMDNYEE